MRFREPGPSQQYWKREINSMPMPMYPEAATDFLGHEFSQHTVSVVESYPERVAHNHNFMSNRLPQVAFVGGVGVGKTSVIKEFSYGTNKCLPAIATTFPNFELEQFTILNCLHNICM